MQMEIFRCFSIMEIAMTNISSHNDVVVWYITPYQLLPGNRVQRTSNLGPLFWESEAATAMALERGVGQNIALYASSAARNSTLLISAHST